MLNVLRDRRLRAGLAGMAMLLLAVTAVFARPGTWLRGASVTPTFAVGFIQEGGVPDSLRMRRVLTDMLATNLARVEGLGVLANSRLLEVMRPGQDSAAGYADAARRAGASELLEGQLRTKPRAAFELEMRRVDLRTGIVKVNRIAPSGRVRIPVSEIERLLRGER